MAVVLCAMDDCVHRSKRASKKWHMTNGDKCYGCTLKAIQIMEPFDFDGDIEAVSGRENMAVCRYYEPMEEE